MLIDASVGSNSLPLPNLSVPPPPSSMLFIVMIVVIASLQHCWGERELSFLLMPLDIVPKKPCQHIFSLSDPGVPTTSCIHVYREFLILLATAEPSEPLCTFKSGSTLQWGYFAECENAKCTVCSSFSSFTHVCLWLAFVCLRTALYCLWPCPTNIS